MLALDSRWQRLMDADYICSCCGKPVAGLMDIGYGMPTHWPHAAREDTQDEIVIGEDRLTPELCRIDGDYFVRTVMEFPIIGTDETFSFGPWGSLSREDFLRFIDHENGQDPSFEGGASWLANDLPLFDDADPIACTLIVASKGGTRPRLLAQEGPLKRAQENGLTFDQLLDIYAAAGHDLRPHLKG
ncbi:MAG: DUF2199 domain-containing protein [Halocynthiibacter sp.]